MNIPLGGIAIGAGAAAQLGYVDAAYSAMGGDFAGALENITNNSVADVAAAAVPVVIYGMVKKAVGPVELFRFGNFRFTM